MTIEGGITRHQPRSHIASQLLTLPHAIEDFRVFGPALADADVMSVAQLKSVLIQGHILLAAGLFALSGCAPSGADDEEEDAIESESAVGSTVEVGTTLRVTASALNLRSGPSTSKTILDVLSKNDVVTCVERSGGNGWVHVENASGDSGWVSRQYVTVVDAVDPDPDPDPQPSGGTCAPSRAEGVVGDFQKALHDSIAFAEGTRNHSKDGYNVMFSFKIMSNCNQHPNQCHKFGSSCSTAAGRYQFLTGTWNTVKKAKGLGTFEPENQEKGAAYLIATTRKVTVPQSRAMTASEFSNAMSKLSWEWASLPPGRYGQPVKTASQMRNFYCSQAGC
jgi:muramidase (phage lysozyme)